MGKVEDISDFIGDYFEILYNKEKRLKYRHIEITGYYIIFLLYLQLETTHKKKALTDKNFLDNTIGLSDPEKQIYKYLYKNLKYFGKDIDEQKITIETILSKDLSHIFTKEDGFDKTFHILFKLIDCEYYTKNINLKKLTDSKKYYIYDPYFIFLGKYGAENILDCTFIVKGSDFAETFLLLLNKLYNKNIKFINISKLDNKYSVLVAPYPLEKRPEISKDYEDFRINWILDIKNLLSQDLEFTFIWDIRLCNDIQDEMLELRGLIISRDYSVETYLIDSYTIIKSIKNAKHKSIFFNNQHNEGVELTTNDLKIKAYRFNIDLFNGEKNNDSKNLIEICDVIKTIENLEEFYEISPNDISHFEFIDPSKLEKKRIDKKVLKLKPYDILILRNAIMNKIGDVSIVPDNNDNIPYATTFKKNIGVLRNKHTDSELIKNEMTSLYRYLQSDEAREEMRSLIKNINTKASNSFDFTALTNNMRVPILDQNFQELSRCSFELNKYYKSQIDILTRQRKIISSYNMIEYKILTNISSKLRTMGVTLLTESFNPTEKGLKNKNEITFYDIYFSFWKRNWVYNNQKLVIRVGFEPILLRNKAFSYWGLCLYNMENKRINIDRVKESVLIDAFKKHLEATDDQNDKSESRFICSNYFNNISNDSFNFCNNNFRTEFTTNNSQFETIINTIHSEINSLQNIIEKVLINEVGPH